MTNITYAALNAGKSRTSFSTLGDFTPHVGRGYDINKLYPELIRLDEPEHFICQECKETISFGVDFERCGNCEINHMTAGGAFDLKHIIYELAHPTGEPINMAGHYDTHATPMNQRPDPNRYGLD